MCMLMHITAVVCVQMRKINSCNVLIPAHRACNYHQENFKWQQRAHMLAKLIYFSFVTHSLLLFKSITRLQFTLCRIIHGGVYVHLHTFIKYAGVIKKWLFLNGRKTSCFKETGGKFDQNPCQSFLVWFIIYHDQILNVLAFKNVVWKWMKMKHPPVFPPLTQLVPLCKSRTIYITVQNFGLFWGSLSWALVEILLNICGTAVLITGAICSQKIGQKIFQDNFSTASRNCSSLWTSDGWTERLQQF